VDDEAALIMNCLRRDAVQGLRGDTALQALFGELNEFPSPKFNNLNEGNIEGN